MASNNLEVPHQTLLPTFSPEFLEDHARRLVNDPKIALVEIVANCWDAGADRVAISWPEDAVPEMLSVEDNGTGMEREQFLHRWLELNYNRSKYQGDMVQFPSDNKASHRRAFGRNGKGRHSVFCFAEKYFVETWCDGKSNTFEVSRSSMSSTTPFVIMPVASHDKVGHGTRIWATLGRNYISVPQVRDLIGSKFIADPTFEIYLNGNQIQLSSLQHLVEVQDLDIAGLGVVCISLVDTAYTSRTSHPHGIAWWVNKRLVGEVSWRDFKDTYDLDRRTIEAKRFTFVVEADILVDEVLEDWSGFRDGATYQKVRQAVESVIKKSIIASLKDVHRARKKSALERNAKIISSLPIDSRYAIGQAVDQIQERVPSIQQKILEATVEVFSNLEQARTGYYLLEQLADLEPGELDQLSEILDKWSVQEARIVLGELERRLKIIEKLEQLVEDPTTDELQDIQPLFARGLWIFGPEYESIHFTSNRTLLTVVRDILRDAIPENLKKRQRPDLVALPDSTIGVYASNSFDSRSEVSGFEKILIVELKRGGFKITLKERRQGEDYARELRKAGKVQPSTKIMVFVLGSEIADDIIEDMEEGNTMVYARPYEVILQQAHARTFFLLNSIREAKKESLYDEDVEEAIEAKAQGNLL
jgi:hypothetical protein